MGTKRTTAKIKDGRPTTCTADVKAKARKYLEVYQDEGDLIPSQAGMACYLGVTRAQLHDWGNVNPDFRCILDDCMAKQERKLLTGGLGGSMNSTITKLVLSKHGYSDRIEQDNTSSDGSMSPSSKDLSDAELDARIKRMIDGK